MTKSVVTLLFLFISLSPVYSQFKEKSLKAANGEHIGFNEFLPEDYRKTGERHPLIIFLHGIGERGDGKKDLSKAVSAGLPKFIRQGHKMRFQVNGKWESFVVLVPQLDSKYGYWRNFYTEEMIKYAKANLNIDPNRIFLTGMSLGGGGVWEFASSSPENAKSLAAIVPVCGTCRLSSAANIAKSNLPIWAFHAEDDKTVTVACTNNAIRNILNAGPLIEPLVTIWPNGNHGIWDRVYDPNSSYVKPNIYIWMLNQASTSGNTGGKSPNQQPVANAGPDQEITLPKNTVTVDGGKSEDKDGKITGYKWTKVSGPDQFKIQQPNNKKTEITNLVEGNYTFRLTVTDDKNATAFDDVIIKVKKAPNQKPVAKAGPDQDITLPKNTAVLDGSGSEDKDGKITSYKWTKVSGPNQFKIQQPNNKKTEITELVEGTYTFRLTVTDDANASATDDVIIKVKKGNNQKPVARAGADQTITLPKNSVIVDGSGSEDTDGKITSYKWTKVSGPNSFRIHQPDNAKTEISELTEGVYKFRLTVTDNEKATAFDELTIKVNKKANTAPKAVITGPTQITLPENTIRLNASESIDPDGEIKTYKWVKKSGPSAYQIIHPHNRMTDITGLEEGTYVFELTVWDKEDAKATATHSVKVLAPEAKNQPPVADAGKNIEVMMPVSSVKLDGSKSYDPDGKIISYYWRMINGPDTYQLKNENSAKAQVTGLQPGKYIFRLYVTDNKNEMRHDDMLLIVLPPNKLPVAVSGPHIVVRKPGETVKLDGSKSYDPDGKIVRYSWTKLSGPSRYNHKGTENKILELSNMAPGIYVFRLRVFDNYGASSVSDTRVTVQTISGGDGLSGNPISRADELPGDPSKSEGIKLYPNPAKDRIQIQLSDEAVSKGVIRIFNSTGAEVKSIQLSPSGGLVNETIMINELVAGVYYLEYRSDKKRLSITFIKQ